MKIVHIWMIAHNPAVEIPTNMDQKLANLRSVRHVHQTALVQAMMPLQKPARVDISRIVVEAVNNVGLMMPVPPQITKGTPAPVVISLLQDQSAASKLYKTIMAALVSHILS